MRIGQKVKILEVGRDYFGPRYTGTEAFIEEIYPDGGTLMVRTFDGIVYISPRSYVESLDIPPIPGILTNNEQSCLHSNKRWTVISGNLKYWYCPTCKEEVK